MSLSLRAGLFLFQINITIINNLKIILKNIDKKYVSVYNTNKKEFYCEKFI